MESLYEPTLDMHGGVVHSSAWRVLKENLLRNLDQTVDFYQTHAMAVASEHFLVRLLHSIDVPMSLSTERYMANVESMCLKLSMALKMTSSIYRGHVFNGIFYGEGSREVLVAWQSDHRVATLDAIDDWRKVVPIRCVRHSLTSLNLELPDGTPRYATPDISVFLIDLPLLAWQYRRFRQEEIAIQKVEGGNQRSTQQFVHMFVLPNMLGSQLDLAIFNRYRHKLNNWPIHDVRSYSHPFQLINYTDRVDAFIDQALTELMRSPRDFTTTMKTIDMVSQPTLFDVVQFPALPPTQQVMWAIAIARLPLILFLFKFNDNNPNTKNRSEVNKILRSVKMYRRNSMMKALSTADLPLVEHDMEVVQTYQ